MTAMQGWNECEIPYDDMNRTQGVHAIVCLVESRLRDAGLDPNRAVEVFNDVENRRYVYRQPQEGGTE